MKTFEDFYNEALTVQQRRKRSIQMKRLAPRLAKKRKLAMKKKADPKKLKMRAQKAAKDVLRKKISKGKPYNSLTPAAKEAIDKKLDKKKAAISKIAKKMLPKIKQKEKERLKNK